MVFFTPMPKSSNHQPADELNLVSLRFLASLLVVLFFAYHNDRAAFYQPSINI